MPATALQRSRPSKKSGGPKSPQLFRKNAGAIQIWNSISVLQRKAFSALLVNAYEELPNFGVLSHTIPISVLAHLAGFNSNNTQYLKEALTGLVTTPIHWNVQRVDGREAWAVSATLASALIENGMVRYSFSTELRKRLYNPEVYAQLDLAVLREFRSGAALALYENCMVFVHQGETPDFTPTELRGLLGAGQPTYDDFSRLMDKVVKPAVSEVNSVSPLQVEPVLRREARRVVSVKFKLSETGGRGASLPNALDGRDPELVMQLQDEMCLAYGTVLKLLDEYTDTHLRAVKEYVKSRRHTVRTNLAGYFLSTVAKATPESLSLKQSTLDLPPTKTEEEVAAEAEAARQAEARREQTRETEACWLALSEDDRKQRKQQFLMQLATENRTVYDSLRRKPLDSGAGYRLLLEWFAGVMAAA